MLSKIRVIRSKIFLFILPLIFIFCSSLINESPGFRIFIIQDSLRKEVQYNDIPLELKKEPFVIEIHLTEIEGVFLSSSFGKLYFDTPPNQRFQDWEYITSKTMAEDFFNKEKKLLMAEEAICYWFYDPEKKWIRMDPKIVRKGNTLICTRTVENLKDTDGDNDRLIPIKDLTKDIYLVFFSRDSESKKELQRKKIHLTFAD